MESRRLTSYSLNDALALVTNKLASASACPRALGAKTSCLSRRESLSLATKSSLVLPNRSCKQS